MIDFVKFAEAKNAALLTFCSVWIGSIITMLRTGGPLPMGYDTALPVALPMLMVSAVITLASFLPRDLRRFFKPADREDKNLLFFGDIAKLRIETYAERVRDRYQPSDCTAYTERYIDDLIVQIAVQSRIAAAKFKAFNIAGLIVLAAFALMALPSVWWALRGAAHAAGKSYGF